LYLPIDSSLFTTLRWLANAHALFAFTALVACDERSAALDHFSEDDAQVVEGDAGDGAGGYDSGLGQDLPPWDEVTPALVDVSGRAVEVVEGGAGSASVIFESGLGSDWTRWDEVAGRVAAAHGCSRIRVLATVRAILLGSRAMRRASSRNCGRCC